MHLAQDAYKDGSEQVCMAAGEQSQTADRWIEQQGGNTRWVAGGEGSRRAMLLCTQLDVNYTCNLNVPKLLGLWVLNYKP